MTAVNGHGCGRAHELSALPRSCHPVFADRRPGPDRAPAVVIEQGEASVLSGSRSAAETALPGAYLRVYSRPLIDNAEVSLMGIAVTRSDGTYRFAVARDGGRFAIRYFFDSTYRPVTYFIRALVLGASGHPYETGSSRELRMRVFPGRFP